MAAKSKFFTRFLCYAVIFSCFISSLAYFYIQWLLEINSCLGDENLHTKWKKLIGWFQLDDYLTEQDGCNIWVWQTHKKTILQFISREYKLLTNAENFYFTCVCFVILLLVVCLFILIVRTSNSKSTGRESMELHEEENSGSVRNVKNTNSQRNNDGNQTQVSNKKTFDFCKLVVNLLFAAGLMSVPWEFVRLYQQEVSKRAATVSLGQPSECTTGSTSLIQNIKSFFLWQFSWSTSNQCEQYFYSLLVDPLWELNPLLVISSAVTRCLLHPMELLFSGLGKSFRAFFMEIPVQWQPVLLIILTLLLLVVILMTCNYRLHIPLLFRIEPKTPVHLPNTNHSNTNHNHSYTAASNHLPNHSDCYNRPSNYLSNHSDPYISSNHSRDYRHQANHDGSYLQLLDNATIQKRTNRSMMDHLTNDETCYKPTTTLTMTNQIDSYKLNSKNDVCLHQKNILSKQRRTAVNDDIREHDSIRYGRHGIHDPVTKRKEQPIFSDLARSGHPSSKTCLKSEIIVRRGMKNNSFSPSPTKPGVAVKKRGVVKETKKICKQRKYKRYDDDSDYEESC